jgi:hypothetical protein
VRYELGSYIPEDGIPLSHRRENSSICWTTRQTRVNVITCPLFQEGVSVGVHTSNGGPTGGEIHKGVAKELTAPDLRSCLYVCVEGLRKTTFPLIYGVAATTEDRQSPRTNLMSWPVR